MIVFDLRCGGAHVFEAWFGSTADFDSQQDRGLIACPMCGDTDVAKAAMAPAVPAKANSRAADVGALLAAQRRLETEADYVGRDFAKRARAVHDGLEHAERPIYGEASLAEAAALIDDGIGVLPLPFRPRARFDA
jgi:hypothetical protein